MTLGSRTQFKAKPEPNSSSQPLQPLTHSKPSPQGTHSPKANRQTKHHPSPFLPRLQTPKPQVSSKNTVPSPRSANSSGPQANAQGTAPQPYAQGASHPGATSLSRAAAFGSLNHVLKQIVDIPFFPLTWASAGNCFGRSGVDRGRGRSRDRMVERYERPITRT
jgi:hypothetical protein